MEFVRHASRVAALALGVWAASANAELPSHPLVQVLKPSSADINTEQLPYRTLNFGNSIAVYKSMALVGESGSNSGSLENSGRVAVFTRRDGTWQRTGTFTSPAPKMYGAFGGLVALENDSALIADSDTLYVYKYTSATGWRVVQWVRPPKSDPISSYPINLAYKCGNALVTAWTNDGSWVVYAYERRSDGLLAFKARWNQPTEYQEFGRSLAVDCDVAAVGAAATGLSEDRPGYPGVYVYRKVNGAWRFAQELNPIGTTPDDGVGKSVAIQGQYIFIGAPDKSKQVDANTGTAQQGVVYVFSRTTGGYAETGQFRPSASESSNYQGFGGALRATEDRLIVRASEYFPVSDSNNDLFFSYTKLGASPQVVGIAHGLPGTWDFRASGTRLFVGGPEANPECYFCALGLVSLYDISQTK